METTPTEQQVDGVSLDTITQHARHCQSNTQANSESSNEKAMCRRHIFIHHRCGHEVTSTVEGCGMCLPPSAPSTPSITFAALVPEIPGSLPTTNWSCQRTSPKSVTQKGRGLMLVIRLPQRMSSAALPRTSRPSRTSTPVCSRLARFTACSTNSAGFEREKV